MPPYDGKSTYSNIDLMKRGKPTNDAGETLKTTDETLAERGKRYGEYKNVAALSCKLDDTIADTIWNKIGNYPEEGKNSWERFDEHFPTYMQESTKMICNKLSRIANGDPMYDDNWRDIAGYAELVVKELNKD